MNKKTIEIKALKEQLINLDHKSNITCTVTCDSVGELMDSCNEFREKLIKPFENEPTQDFYYFLIQVKPNIIIKVVSRKVISREIYTK